MAYQLHPIYIRDMPRADELEQLSNAQLDMFNKTLQDELSLIQEETIAMTNHSQARRDAEAGKAAGGGGGAGGAGGDGSGEGLDGGEFGDDVAAVAATVAVVTSTSTGGGKRRGKGYRRKSSEQKQLILAVHDKMAVIAEEHERLKDETQRAKESSVEARDLMHATRTESENRINELALARTYFARDVVDGEPASAAERLVNYIADRPRHYQRQLRKLEEKSALMQQQLRKLEQQLDATGDTGDKFIRIDYDQLTIENQQYSERLADKEKELKQLKTMTTRTVQTLNSLTDRLSQLLGEQTSSARDLNMRREHCAKLEKELLEVRAGGGVARGKNTSLKIQHESVKVPKVEEYIFQKAEEHDLRKAVGNWRRKVEIARGHVHVMKQKARETHRQAVAAAEARSALLQPSSSGFNFRATMASLRGGGAVATDGASPQRTSGRSATSGAEAIPAPPPAAASSGMRRR